MAAGCTTRESFEISPRFRRNVEERIARLERDAAYDEAQMERLDDIDHIRRQIRLVAAQRAEALRMRLFLDRATTVDQASRTGKLRPEPFRPQF